jgi:hypothetical protein
MTFHPSKFDALQSMKRPELACDLVQFTCALNWMRTSILNNAEVAAPLLGLLEDCYAEAGGRTKKKLRQLSSTPKLGPAHQRSFDQLKQLSSFRYTIEAITGEVSKFADSLTRWAVRPRSTISRLARLVTAPISRSTFSEYDWPDRDSLKNAQLAADDPVPQECTVDSEGLARYQSQAVWIPDGDKTLQLRLLIAAHTGPGGHRRITTTEQAMNGFVQWKSMRKDLASFVNSCIHCLSTSTGGTVPISMAQTLHAEKPNKLPHFDFLYVGHGLKGVDYILVLKDDISSYCRLIPSVAANAVTTAAALIDWFATFGVVLDWVSDRGSHFRNFVVRLFREQNHSSHCFTLA